MPSIQIDFLRSFFKLNLFYNSSSFRISRILDDDESRIISCMIEYLLKLKNFSFSHTMFEYIEDILGYTRYR